MRLSRTYLIAAGIVALLAAVIGYGALALFTGTGEVSLPGPLVSGGADGSPDGEWMVADGSGSFAGYRMRERLGPVAAPNDAVGRTSEVTVAATIDGNALTAANVTVAMDTLRSDLSGRDGRLKELGLETSRYPKASFTLREPVSLEQMKLGEAVALQLPGELTLHGVAQPLDLPLLARWDGNAIAVTTQHPIRVADYGISVDNIFGFHLSETGQIEVELTLVKQGSVAGSPRPGLAHVPGAPAQNPEEQTPCEGGSGPAVDGVLAFGAVDPELVGRVFAVAADGSNLRELTGSGSFDGAPDWSADGKKLLFSRYNLETEDAALSVMNSDGAGMNDLLPGRIPEGVWSPDGTKIAFVAATESSATLEVINTDGSGRRHLAGGKTARAGEPSWSPDGQKIVFRLYGGEGNDDIAIVNADGSGLRRLTSSPAYENTPAWSPDGKSIAFARDGALRLMSAEGADERSLTAGPYDSAPAWSPDGQHMAFVRDGSIFVMNADGSSPACVPTGKIVRSAPRWQPMS